MPIVFIALISVLNRRQISQPWQFPILFPFLSEFSHIPNCTTALNSFSRHYPSAWPPLWQIDQFLRQLNIPCKQAPAQPINTRSLIATKALQYSPLNSWYAWSAFMFKQVTVFFFKVTSVWTASRMIWKINVKKKIPRRENWQIATVC